MSFIYPTPPWPVVSGVDYGTCLSCFLRSTSIAQPDGSTLAADIFDLAPTGGMVSGRQALAEALARRLVTTRGTLVDDADYGFDLRAFVNDDIDARGLALVASGADAEMLKDDRVIHSSTTAQLVGGVLILTISITDGIGPFKLTLAVTNVSISILQVGVASQ